MVSNFIKYLVNIRAHFTIKNRIAKKKGYISITIRPIIFFKSIIRLIQIFRGANSYFCRLNFENIKIIIYFLKVFKMGRGGGEGDMAPTLLHSFVPEQRVVIDEPTIGVGVEVETVEDHW